LLTLGKQKLVAGAPAFLFFYKKKEGGGRKKNNKIKSKAKGIKLSCCSPFYTIIFFIKNK
jgi:hypothetical protein